MRIVTDLCDRLFKTPNDKVLTLKQQFDSPLHEAVKDYVENHLLKKDPYL